MTLLPVLRDDLLFPQTEDLVLLPYFSEGSRGLVEMVFLVGGGELGADLRLAVGDDRGKEANSVDAVGEEIARDILGEFRVVEHDRDNRAFAFFDVESGAGQEFAPVTGVFFELVASFGWA